MSTAVALRDALGVFRPAGVFFEALDQADKAIERVQRLELLASFAPPLTRFGSCTCGSVYEDRSERIDLTDDERDAVADALGGARHFADIVVGAINAARDREGHEAFRDWYDAHTFCDCGDDL